MRKTLEGGRPWKERAPLERGALSLQTSLSPENFPQEHPPLYGENLFRYVWAGALGESFLFLGRYFFAECGFAPVLFWRCIKDIPYVDSALAKRFQKTERHMGRSLQTLFSILPQSRIPFRTLQKIRTSHPSPKTSPQDPHHQKDETNLRSSHGGGLVGKFGEVEGGLEGEGTPSERGFLLPPRSFHPLPPPRQPQNKTVEEVEERGENESNHQNRGNRADAEQKSHR